MEVQDFLHNQNPMTILAQWMSEGCQSLKEPLAMVLSTVGAYGQPSSRVVLAKEIRETGVVFYTNYNSKKGQDIETNPRCALNFFWDSLSRQVRVEGRLSQLPADQSDAYWKSRPRASQISQWISQQSQPVSSRSELEKLHANAEKRFANSEVPRPLHWGGYLVTPDRIEFWIGSPVRLHDRFVYTATQGQWNGQRLSP